MAFKMNALLIYLGIVLVMSLVTLIIYSFDKQRANSGGRRVSESTLQILSFMGGWPGAILAQRQFRHKTKKMSFLIAFWGLVVLHIAIVVGVAYSLLKNKA